MLWIDLILAVLFFLLLSVFLWYAADSALGGYDFSTSALATKKIAALIKSRNLESGYLMDLGSCRGQFASRLARALPNLRVCGIDNDIFRIFLAKTRSIFLRKLSFKKGDIFSADVSVANMVYIYLPKEMMPKLQNRLRRELKKGSLVITNRVNFPDWPPAATYDLGGTPATLDKLFIYQTG